MQNTLSAKYIHVALTNAPCKWKDINLSNLAKEMAPWEAAKCLQQLHPMLQSKYQDRFDRFGASGCPEIILEKERKILQKVKDGKHAHLTNLSKRTKEA